MMDISVCLPAFEYKRRQAYVKHMLAARGHFRDDAGGDRFHMSPGSGQPGLRKQMAQGTAAWLELKQSEPELNGGIIRVALDS